MERREAELNAILRGRVDVSQSFTGSRAAGDIHGRVGGGGYDTRHGLDAQRENDRLTRETNQLIGQGNTKLDTLAGGGKIGLIIFAVASIIKDAANRFGDLLNDGKPNGSFKS